MSQAPLDPAAQRRLLQAAAPLLTEALAEGATYGRYRLVRELGRGGMGVVWEAEDEELGRRVALKFLQFAPGASDERRERFLREARAAARLSHPGIAAVHDADDRAIALQLVDGRPLSEQRDVDPRRAASWVREAALAVHHAHGQGVVHRDLKPHNLLLEGERVVVTDFGLAQDAREDAALSTSGALLGTPGYMAPEQARGGRADARTDVWGLGATLFDLLCGRPPFVGADLPDTLRRIAEDTPPVASTLRAGLAPDLVRVVQKALERDPARRYPTAAALADDLQRFLEGRPVAARPPSLAYRLRRLVARHAAASTLLGIALLALATAVGTQLARRAAARVADSTLELSEAVAATLEDDERHRRAGEVELANARLDEGIARTERFVARHATARGFELLGRLYAARDRGADARAAFDRALELRPDLLGARVARGLLLARDAATRAVRGDGDEDALARQRAAARADLDAAAGRESDLTLVERHLRRAELARLADDLDAAEGAFREVLRLDPLHAEARRARAELSVQRGDGDTALALALSALDLQRGYGPAYATSGAGAWIDVEPLLAAGPNDALVRANRAQVHARRADALEAEGRLREARDAWTDAVTEIEAACALAPEATWASHDRDVARSELARVRALVDQRPSRR